ncbi:DDE-type integrase/transposase/recombinase [Paracraurococcus ruber]|uniref:DDE domain-containing protein n=1 Tax=Paracraurococcus ruber TaxID=77675 RepID=A0ABS1CX93_9PROT|nr:DDE-type integrase/transposase/recombinase [Paracraurococcus ruber]MBK1659156.1 hypothetical protein [Paracraurococcus ruber]TDG29875.1 IS6 family transposase [Paracraurococcus ruber]
MTTEPAACPGCRLSAAIIGDAVRLDHAFGLSLGQVEPSLAERGIGATHEGIRPWCRKSGADLARRLRQSRPKPGDGRHFDAVFPKTAGRLPYPWRAVDQHGVVPDILARRRRNATAATRFSNACLPARRTSRSAASPMACAATGWRPATCRRR